MAPSAELATAYVTLVSSASGLGQSITGELANAGQQSERAGKESGSKFAGAFAGFVAAGALVAGVGKGLYEVGAVFDDVADTIRVGTGATGEALDGLVASAERIGTRVPASFAEIGPIVADLNTRLGLTGDTLETVGSQYAAAGKILGEAVDIQATSAAFSAFGIAGADVEGAMDRLYQVSQATGVGFNDLAGQVQKNAPAVQALGFSFEQTTGLIGNLDKAGLNSSAVLASLGKGLVTLAKQGEEPAAAFQRVTGEIGDLIAKGDTAAALDLASGIFGTKGATQFVAAVQSGTIATGDFGAVAGITTDTILQASADTADFAESLQLFKNGALLALKPAGELVFGAVGSAMAKAVTYAAPLGAALSRIIELVIATFKYLRGGDLTVFAGLATDAGGFLSVLETVRGGIVAVGKFIGQLGAVIGPIFAAVGKEVAGTFGGAFSAIGATLSAVFTQLGPIFGQLIPAITPLLGLLNPVGLVLKALIPVLPVLAAAFGQIAVAVGGALVTALGQIAPLFPLITSVIAEVVAILAQGLMQAITAVVPLVLSLVDVFSAVLPVVVELVSSVLPRIAPLFEALVPVLASVVESLVAFLIPAIEALLPVVVTVFEAVGPIIDAAMTIVQGIITAVTGIISGDWSMVWNGIKTVFEGVWNGVNAFITGAVAILQSILSAAWEAIKPVVSAAWDLIKSFIITPLTAAYNWVRDVFAGVSTVMGTIMGAVKTAAQTVLNTLYDIFIKPFVDFKNWLDNTLDISTPAGKVWRAVKTAASTVLDTLYGIFIEPFVKAYYWVENTFSDIVGKVQGIVSSIKGAWQDLKNTLSAPLKISTGFGPLGALQGNIPSNADGGIYDARPGGHIVQVAEAGKRELITPEDLMAKTFRDVLASSRIAVDGRGGRSLAGRDIVINTQDPDVQGALDQLLFRVTG